MTFAWLTLSKLCQRPLHAATASSQNEEGGGRRSNALDLSLSEVVKLKAFCEAAIGLAAVSVATIPHRLASAALANADRPTSSVRAPAFGALFYCAVARIDLLVVCLVW